MKKSFFSLLMVVIVAIVVAIFSSCSDREKTQLEEQRFRVVEPEFFYVVTETVKSGDTVWDRAKVYYGSGLRWKDVVAQNPFLQQPGRVWQDKVSGHWYVLIFPGERLIMNQTEVRLTFVDSIDTPVVKQQEESTPWWVWLLSVLGIAGVVMGIIALTRCCNNNNQREVVSVNIPHGGDINKATASAVTAYQERSYQFRERTAGQMLNHPDLVRATMSESSDPTVPFTLVTEYKR